MTKIKLSTEVVLDLAEECAEALGNNGVAELTLAPIAAKAHVTVPSIYKHVTNLADLRERLAARAFAQLNDAVVRATVGRSGLDALGALAHAYRDYARAHPAMYGAAQGPVLDSTPTARESRDEFMRTVTAIVAGMGIAEEYRVDAMRAIRATLHGFSQLENSGGFSLANEVDTSFDRVIFWLGSAITQAPELFEGARNPSHQKGHSV